MEFKKSGSTYIVRLDKGEEVMRELTLFCKTNNIKFAEVSGIGGAREIRVKYYDINSKQYVSKKFDEQNYEITSLCGNIAIVDGEPFLHLHISFADQEYKSFGGHLESAVIGITCEIILKVADAEVTRKFNDEFKLKFLDF